MMNRNFLIVDAHNVIFAHPELASLHARNPAAAREDLIHQLEHYQDSTASRVVAVFDGSSSPLATSQLSSPAGIQTIYPKAGQSADDIIERLALKYAKIHSLTVASDDLLIRTAAEAAGAFTISTTSLFDEMKRAAADLTQSIHRLRKK